MSNFNDCNIVARFLRDNGCKTHLESLKIIGNNSSSKKPITEDSDWKNFMGNSIGTPGSIPN